MNNLLIVVPAFNEQDNILKFIETTVEIIDREKIEFEIVFVDDGSTDNTWQQICYSKDKYGSLIHAVRLSRNFGKEAAILAGLAESSNFKCVAVMDCDLQHPLDTLVKMYHFWEQGYQVVEGIKENRTVKSESLLRRKGAQFFYSIMTKSTGLPMENMSDFKLLDRTAVDAILSMPERNTFFRAMSTWIGFRSLKILYTVKERFSGKSKWPIKQLFKYAVDNIIEYSSIPMQFVTVIGGLFLLFSIIMCIQSLINYFSGGAADGFTTVILLQLIVGSIVMIALGVIGVYIAKIYDEVKKKPRYIISQRI